MNHTDPRLVHRIKYTKETLLEQIQNGCSTPISLHRAISNRLDNLINFMKSCNIDPNTNLEFGYMIKTLVLKIGTSVSYENSMELIKIIMDIMEKYHCYDVMWSIYELTPPVSKKFIKEMLPDHLQSAIQIMK